MTLMTDKDFDTFFSSYAPQVAGFDEADYWRLSDELIKELVRRHLGLAEGARVVDVGGGTGRWGAWMAREFGVRVTIADRSKDMLNEAAATVASLGLTDLVDLVACDIHDAPELPTASADAVLSTYGVLSFLDDPQAAFREVARVMKPGATGLLMSHSFSNALTSKICRDGAGAEELAELGRTRIVKWAPHVPALRVFSTTDLSELATNAGLEVTGMFGVTALTMPGPEDFGYPYTTLSTVSQALRDPEYFRTVLDLELKASEEPGWAERGVNLMIKVRRP
ncbi:MAG: methyltransferase domain-containing protein [Kineosporiaceae bacterium]